jgi:hypothetical protein
MAKKITQKTITSNVLNISEISKEEDFVACTTEIDDEGTCYHSGLLICFEGELKYFHYTGKTVELVDTLPKNLYFKKTDLIEEELICSFLWHCEKLSNEANPIYGFFFDESYYDSNGDYYLKNSKYDITTCVGFCLKVLTGFLKTPYLETNDWDVTSLDSLGDKKNRFLIYLHGISIKEGINIGELFNKDKLKRILPSEMFSTSFYAKTPIRKIDTDEILNLIENHFSTLAVA